MGYGGSRPTEIQIDPSSLSRGEQTPVPSSLLGKGARGLGLGVPHLSENYHITLV